MMSRGRFITANHLSRESVVQIEDNYLVLMVLEGRLIASWGLLYILFNKCPGVFLLKLVCLRGILIFALLWGCIWNSPLWGFIIYKSP